MRRRSTWIAIASLLVGCGSDPSPADDTTDGTTDEASEGSDGDTSESDGSEGTADDTGGEPELPPLPSDDWCDRVRGGPASDEPFVLGLSAAHATARFFAPHPDGDYVDVDLALVGALGDALDEGLLETYADGYAAICAVEAGVTLPDASVELVGGVAVLTPGAGELGSIPPEAEAIAIDLREVIAGPDGQAALDAALALALGEDVPGPMRRFRQHNGMRAELFSGSVYTMTLADVEEPGWTGSASASRPLLLLTGPQLSPAAATAAVELRVRNRAWIVGEDLMTAVAEATWQATGQAGVAVRTSELLAQSTQYPDVVPADLRALDPIAAAAGQTWGLELPAINAEPGTRDPITVLPVVDEQRPRVAALDYARAALVITHGSARRFFGFIEQWGDEIDTQLEQELADLTEEAATEESETARALLRLLRPLDDGHVFAGSNFGNPFDPDRFFPAVFEMYEGRPVVRRSVDMEVLPGDTLTAVNGQPIEDFLEDQYALYSWATPEGGFQQAMRYWRSTEPFEVTLEDPDGMTRDVTVDGLVPDDYGELGYPPVVRPSGPLDDLGYPNLYYINVATELDQTSMDVAEHIEAAQDSDGLVVDVRGYPGSFNHYDLVGMLFDRPVPSPIFTSPTWTGPDNLEYVAGSFDIQPFGTEPYLGPVVALSGTSTISAAENLLMVLRQEQRATIIGDVGYGTNGDVTGNQLPGSFRSVFTGTQVTFADGSDFFAIGVVPDVMVIPTPTQLRDGEDPELMAAITDLSD